MTSCYLVSRRGRLETRDRTAALEDLRGKLEDAPGSDWEALHEWAKKEQTVARRLENLMKDWVRSSEELKARESAEANG